MTDVGGGGRFAGLPAVRGSLEMRLVLVLLAAVAGVLAWRSPHLQADSATNWITAGVAIAALVLGWRQLDAIRIAEQTAAQQAEAAARSQAIAAKQSELTAATAKATLLLRLDQQFEGPAVVASRKIWAQIFVQFDDEPRLGVPSSSAERAPRTTALISHWHALRRTETDSYRAIMTLPNWIETLGVVARSHEGMEEMFDSLYGSTIMGVMERLEPYLLEKPNEIGNLSNALELSRRIRFRRSKKVEI